MKKLIIMVLVLTLLLSGCATFGQQAQDKICNAPDDVIQVADIVLNLLKPVASAYIPGSAAYVALVTAQGIKTTGCATVTAINTMISFIQGFNTKAMMDAQGVKVAPKLIDTTPLQTWRDKHPTK